MANEDYPVTQAMIAAAAQIVAVLAEQWAGDPTMDISPALGEAFETIYTYIERAVGVPSY